MEDGIRYGGWTQEIYGKGFTSTARLREMSPSGGFIFPIDSAIDAKSLYDTLTLPKGDPMGVCLM